MTTEYSTYIVPITTILATGLTVFATILLFIIRQKNEQIQLIQNKVSDKKYEAYNEVLSIFFDIFKSVKDYKKLKQNELPNRIIDAKKLLIIYASDPILFKFFEWNEEAQKTTNSYNLAVFIDLIILIRKDMGHPTSRLTRENVLRSICNSDETYDELKHLISKENNDNIDTKNNQ